MTKDDSLLPLIKMWNNLKKKFVKNKKKITSDNINDILITKSANNIYDIKNVNNNIFKKNNSFNIKIT